jgi:hypothetical protein
MAGSGSWRRPRMKVYDYNHDFGGNYYQPMLEYLNTKDTYGPYHKRTSVYLPERAEICSQKYTNMRYKDKSSAKLKMDTFLESAYTKQIKELNKTTAMAKLNMMKTIVSDRRQPHSAVDNVNTPLNSIRLLHGAPPGLQRVNHYMTELCIEKNNKHKLDTKQRKHLVMLQATDDEYNYHHKLFGDGTVDRDMVFYNPQLIRDYVNQIRRV